MIAQPTRSDMAHTAARDAGAEIVRNSTANLHWIEQLDREGPPVFVGEFWTAGQRKGHSLHEVSYRACFKPQLPEYFIERLTKPGDVVFDPFMGRGTTLIQAALMGRRPVGNDINPLSAMLARPRISPPLLAEIDRRLADIPWGKVGATEEAMNP